MIDTVLKLVKATLGYSTDVRDMLLKKIIESVVDELEKNKGIVLDEKNNEQVMFICDLVVFRYKNQGASIMPRNLEYRLRNIIVRYRGKADVG